MPDITINHARQAMLRAADALEAARDHFTELDQAVGDGDLGVTTGKIAVALKEQLGAETPGDIGKFLLATGMAINRAAPSTMGTLIATGLLRAGKQAAGKSELSDHDLVLMLEAASNGIQERGKASPGDKTIVDALQPSAQAFRDAIEAGDGLEAAGRRALHAAEAGRDSVTSQRSRIGRAHWVGERTAGQVDPGCEVWVTVLRALLTGPAGS